MTDWIDISVSFEDIKKLEKFKDFVCWSNYPENKGKAWTVHMEYGKIQNIRFHAKLRNLEMPHESQEEKITFCNVKLDAEEMDYLKKCFYEYQEKKLSSGNNAKSRVKHENLVSV